MMQNHETEQKELRQEGIRLSAAFSVPRFVLSLFLALLVFLALSYKLFIPGDEELAVLSHYEGIQAVLSTYGFKGNLYTLGIAALIYLWFSAFGVRSLISSRALLLVSCFFGLLNQAGLNLFYIDMLPKADAKMILLFFFQAAVWGILFLMTARVAWALFTKAGERSAIREKRNSRSDVFFEKHLFLCAFLIILLGWLPWIVSYYPASMDWDVYDPIRQYLGFVEPSNHHPWFYASTIGMAFRLGQGLGNKNLGIFLYILFRDLLMAAMYGRSVVLQRKNGMPRVFYTLTILFFAITPVWGAYAKHAFKDAIAAALFCWYIHVLADLILNIDAGKLKTAACLEYTSSVLLGCLFRNNTVYVVLPITILLAAFCLLRRKGIKVILMLMLGVFAFRAYQGYAFEVRHVWKGSMAEMLSIPFQQTARTLKNPLSELSDGDMQVLDNYWDEAEKMGEWYDPIISDPVKNRIKITSEDLGDYAEYLRLWWRMGWKYPYSYLEAFIAHSSGYYTFTPEYTESQRYGPGNHANVGMTIFNWVEDSRFPEWLRCKYADGTEGLRTWLDRWAEIWHQIPILNLTDMKPLYTWLTLALGLFFLKRKEYEKLLPVGACILMILTCVASPVNDCFRYFAPAAAAFPGLFILLKGKGKSAFREENDLIR